MKYNLSLRGKFFLFFEAMSYQLEFDFSEFSDIRNENLIATIRDDVRGVKESSDKVRKSLFARHNELAKKYTDLNERMRVLERNICLGVASM